LLIYFEVVVGVVLVLVSLIDDGFVMVDVVIIETVVDWVAVCYDW